MLGEVFREAAKAVLKEETHGDAGGVGGQAEYIEMLIRPQGHAVPVTGRAVSDLLEHGGQILLAHALADTEQAAPHGVLIGRLAVLRPADHGGVADLAAVLPVGEQGVQRGGIGESGVFAHRGVFVLLVAVGCQRRGVEGHQRRAGGLRPIHTLDLRVGQGNGGGLAGDKALAAHPIAAVAVIVRLPRGADGLVLAGGSHAVIEHQVGVSGHFLPQRGDEGMLLCFFRLPVVKVGQDGPCGRGVHPVQQAVVQLRRGGKALLRPLRLALVVRPQQITDVVAQQVGGDAGGAGDAVGNGHEPGRDHGLFAPLFFTAQVEHIQQLTVFAQLQTEGDLEVGVPPRPRQLALLAQHFKVAGQSL